MARIIILGCSGSGKSRLARMLGARDGTPVISLDDIWPPGSGAMDVASFRETMTRLHSGDAWISDGNFAVATFDIRLPRATLVVWLDCPRRRSLWRATLRALGGDRVHHPRNLPAAWRYIWNFDRISRPLIEAQRHAHGPDVPVLHLDGDRAVDAFVAGGGPK